MTFVKRTKRGRKPRVRQREKQSSGLSDFFRTIVLCFYQVSWETEKEREIAMEKKTASIHRAATTVFYRNSCVRLTVEWRHISGYTRRVYNDNVNVLQQRFRRFSRTILRYSILNALFSFSATYRFKIFTLRQKSMIINIKPCYCPTRKIAIIIITIISNVLKTHKS